MKKLISILTASVIACGTLCAAVFAEEGVILDAGFESDTCGFVVRGSATLDTSEEAHSGVGSLFVDGRGGQSWEGAGRALSGIKLDETYNVVAYAKAAVPDDSFEVKLTLEITDHTGTNYPQLATATVNGNGWTKLEGSWKANYKGNLDKLNLNLETNDAGTGKSFYVDDVFFALSSIKPPQVTEPPVKPKNISYSGIEISEDVTGTQFEKSIGLMQSLGVMNGYPDGSFKPDNQVTRAEFLTMLLRLIRAQGQQNNTTDFIDVPAEHFANGYIGYAVARGICSGYGHGIFGPDDPVTYAQAVKMLMSTMGYGTVAEANGGYPDGYMTAAADVKIGAKGVMRDEAMTRGNVTELFASAIDVPLYMKDYSDNTIYRDKNATIITEYYDGVYKNGYVVSSNISTVSNSLSSIDCVNIDGIEYKKGKTRADELVGSYVKYIASQPEKGDNGELLYIDINDAKNETLTIAAKDIDSYADNRYSYYPEGTKNRTKYAALTRDFNLIFNGKSVSASYSEDLMIPKTGEVKLISDGSGNYSTVMITSYETHVVDSVSRAVRTVYDKNRVAINLDYDDKNIEFTDERGKELDFSAITTDSIISVAAPVDGDDIRVIITNRRAEGVITRTSDETIVIDGNEYELSTGFTDHNNLPEIGKTVTAYLDLDGRVFYIESSGVSGMKLGYLMKCFADDDGTYNLRLYTSDSKTEVFEFNRNVNIDGKSYSEEEAARHIMGLLEKSYSNNMERASNRIVLYSANSSNRISKIDTAADRSDGDNTIKPALTINENRWFSYKQNTSTFYNNANNQFFSLEPDSVIFSIPNDDSKTEDYTVKTKNGFGWGDYEIYPFKIDDGNLLIPYAVEYTNEGSNFGNEGYVITKIMDGLNSENEVTKVVELYNGTKTKYALKDDSIWKPEWEVGSIVRVSINSRNEIAAMENATSKGTIMNDYEYCGTGWIYEMHNGWGYFTTEKPNAGMDVSNMALIPVDKFNIIIYDKSKKECYIGSYGDIIDYVSDPKYCSKVYITMNYENPKNMICVLDY